MTKAECLIAFIERKKALFLLKSDHSPSFYSSAAFNYWEFSFPHHSLRYCGRNIIGERK